MHLEPGIAAMAAASSSASRLIVAGALGAVAVEWVFIRLARHAAYPLRESAMSILMGLGYAKVTALAGFVWGWLYFLCYQHRIFELPAGAWWKYPLLFVLVDFCFYWQHRYAHMTRLGWASHVQHHSVQDINMAAPFRLSLTSTISGYQAFYAPLALLGFHPVAVAVMVLVNVGLQCPLHTELVRRLWWPIEFIFNTPAHHRIHHASNTVYLDKNLGGMFIVWDRLFGTYQDELPETPLVYGLVKPLPPMGFARTVWTLWFSEWRRMAGDAWRARRWTHKLGHVFRPPAWSPTPD